MRGPGPTPEGSLTPQLLPDRPHSLGRIPSPDTPHLFPEAPPRDRLTRVAIVAQAQLWEWWALEAEEFHGSQGGAKNGELRTDIYRGLEAASAGWGHLGPGRVASVAPVTVVIPFVVPVGIILVTLSVPGNLNSREIF